MGFIGWICHSLIVSCKPVYIFSETCGLHSAPHDAVQGLSAGKSPSYREEKGHKPDKMYSFYKRIKYFFFGIKSAFKMDGGKLKHIIISGSNAFRIFCSVMTFKVFFLCVRMETKTGKSEFPRARRRRFPHLH